EGRLVLVPLQLRGQRHHGVVPPELGDVDGVAGGVQAEGQGVVPEVVVEIVAVLVVPVGPYGEAPSAGDVEVVHRPREVQLAVAAQIVVVVIVHRVGVLEAQRAAAVVGGDVEVREARPLVGGRADVHEEEGELAGVRGNVVVIVVQVHLLQGDGQVPGRRVG